MEALAQGEGKASCRLISVDDLFYINDIAEKNLEDLQISPSSRIGAVWKHTQFFDGPGSQWSQNSTQVILERRRAGWFLIGVERVRVSAWKQGGGKLFLTPIQDKIAVKKLRSRYEIRSSQMDPAS